MLLFLTIAHVFFIFYSSSCVCVCVCVCVGYDGWYLPRAVHGDELSERRPGARSPRSRGHAGQGPWDPSCWSTQVRRCKQIHKQAFSHITAAESERQYKDTAVHLLLYLCINENAEQGLEWIHIYCFFFNCVVFGYLCAEWQFVDTGKLFDWEYLREYTTYWIKGCKQMTYHTKRELRMVKVLQ